MTRMYNIAMHMHIDPLGYPWRWLQYWSRVLERDLTQRRLDSAKPRLHR